MVVFGPPCLEHMWQAGSTTEEADMSFFFLQGLPKCLANPCQDSDHPDWGDDEEDPCNMNPTTLSLKTSTLNSFELPGTGSFRSHRPGPRFLALP